MFNKFGLVGLIGFVGMMSCAQPSYRIIENNENKYGEVYDIPEVKYESDEERARWEGKELMYLHDNNIQKSKLREEAYG